MDNKILKIKYELDHTEPLLIAPLAKLQYDIPKTPFEKMQGAYISGSAPSVTIVIERGKWWQLRKRWRYRQFMRLIDSVKRDIKLEHRSNKDEL